MRDLVYLLPILMMLLSCQSTAPQESEIVFGDVIGEYIGECADYNSMTQEVMNREEATLSVFASSITLAGIKTSCDRIMDQSLPVTSASASHILFEKKVEDSKITMTYVAKYDSISLIQVIDGDSVNLMFTGIRN